MRLATVLLFLASLAAAAPAWAAQVAGPAQVLSGDTVVIGHAKIRLFGIDAPETLQTCTNSSNDTYQCGLVSADALRAKIGSRNVRCDGSEQTAQGDLLGVCWLGVENLNGWLVSEGLAVVNPIVSTRFLPQEADAKAAQRGLWAGNFTMPWDWRQQHP